MLRIKFKHFYVGVSCMLVRKVATNRCGYMMQNRRTITWKLM